MIATARGLAQEIGVTGDEYSPLSARPVEQFRILALAGSVFLCRNDIHATQAQLRDDGGRNVDIHVEAEAHLGFFRAWSFWRSDGSESCGSNRFASSYSRLISASSFSRCS